MATRSLALLLACGLVLAACSGGGSDREDEAAIEKTIAAFSKTDDPADCRKLATERFLEQEGKVDYETALTICEEAAVDPLVEDAQKVTVSRVEVEGDAATAVAAYVGSGFDGQTVRLALVDRDGRWKLDELLGFIDFDAQKMVTELGREMLRTATFPQEAETFTCVIERLGEMSEEDLEALLLDESDRLLELAQSCVSRSKSL